MSEESPATAEDQPIPAVEIEAEAINTEREAARQQIRAQLVAEMKSKLFRSLEATPKRLAVSAVVGLILGLAIALLDPDRSIQGCVVGGLVGTVIVPTYFLLISGAANLLGRTSLLSIRQKDIEIKSSVLQDSLEEDFFNNLVKINFKYIDKYYLQTQLQADKSFYLSAIAAVVGFAIVIAGIVQMYLGKTPPAIASLASGVISEFVAAVFFYLYNQTVVKMADYHRKLVLTQNVSLALRITQDLPEEARVETQRVLVDRLTDNINMLLAASAEGVTRGPKRRGRKSAST